MYTRLLNILGFEIKEQKLKNEFGRAWQQAVIQQRKYNKSYKRTLERLAKI
jgi:hypothetical protein